MIIAVALIVMQTRGLYSTNCCWCRSSTISTLDLVIGSLEHYPHLVGHQPFFALHRVRGAGDRWVGSNAVNLTDGLDGLAIGCTVIAAGALAVLTYVSGHATFQGFLSSNWSVCRRWANLTIFCVRHGRRGNRVSLRYNAHPAEVFMGDVGRPH